MSCDKAVPRLVPVRHLRRWHIGCSDLAHVPVHEKEPNMCANCGCGIPEDKHGDERNITWSQIEQAAAANDQSTDEAVRNIETMAKHEHEHAQQR